MSRKRTIPLASLLSLSMAVPASADDDLVRTFAACAGRLSAQLEHQWLMRDDAAGQTEQIRHAMLELLDLVSSDETSVQAMSLRIEAKHLQARLLSQATFDNDPDRAGWAGRRAAFEIAACTGLLLS